MIACLGATDRLVGISHECDDPTAGRQLPRLTTSAIDPSAPSAVIDAEVRAAVAGGRAVIGIDARALEALRPDLVLTQSLCEVCAVADGEAFRLAAVLDPPPRVLTLAGRTLAGVLDDLEAVAAALELPARGREVRAALEARLAACGARGAAGPPVDVLVIEWLDPPFLAGHWTPEVIAAAGGRDLAMQPGEHSTARRWEELLVLDPAVVVVAVCGFDEARAREELGRLTRPDVRDWLSRRRVAVIDGNAYTSRAGPRLVEAAERLATLLRAGDPAPG